MSNASERAQHHPMNVDMLASAGVISQSPPPRFDALGPQVELITRPHPPPSAPGLVRGTIAPGGFVPMHSHGDAESFFVLGGVLEGLTFASPDEPRWVALEVGEAFHVPPHARHALRNTSDQPATTLIITTHDLVAFFAETGRPLNSADHVPGPATSEDVGRLVAAAMSRGHWLASVEENAAVGIDLGAPPAG